MANAAFATSDPTGEADAPLPSLPAVISTQGIGGAVVKSLERAARLALHPDQ